MFHIDNKSGVAVMPPVKEKLSDNPLFFTEGGNGTPPSWPGADWFNIVQSELLNILFKAGIEPDKASTSQVYEAISQLFLSRTNPFADIKADGTTALFTALENLGFISDDADKGDALLTVLQPYANAVAITQHQHNAFMVTPYHFKAKGDGIADDTFALNRWANCGAKSLYWPPGKYLVTPANGSSLDMANYQTGDAALRACVTVPYGVKIFTAGTATQLCVKDPDPASTVGIAITSDVTKWSAESTKIERFMLRLENGNGRYGIITPVATDVFLRQRPGYEFQIHFAPEQGRDDLTVLNYSWANGMLIGEALFGDFEMTGFGNYNATLDDTGQYPCIAARTFAKRGNVGCTFRFNTNNWRKFVEIGDSTEGFVIHNSEGLGAMYGIDATNTADEPGGYIDNCHMNVKQVGVRARNRPFLQIGMVEVYRADNFAPTPTFNAVEIVDCGEVTIASVHTIVGNGFSNGLSAVHATRSTFRLGTYFVQNTRFVDYLVDCPDCYVGVGTININEAVHSLYGSQSNDFHGSDVLVRAYRDGVRPKYAVMDPTFNRSRARFPQDTNLQVRKYLENSISAAGTLTIEPRLDPSSYFIIMNPGAAAFTYNIELDKVSGVPGDIVYIKIAGSSSPNPTVVIRNGIGGLAINTFNNIGAIRLNCAYRMDESLNWRAAYVTQSTESSYV